MNITPQQAEALGRLLLAIRPDWSKHYTTEAVRDMRHINPDLEAIIAAAVRGALTPKIAKPDVLAMNGEHWRPKAAAGRTGAPTLIEGRCGSCGQLHVANELCPPPLPVSQAATAGHVDQARAAITAARAGHCAHGVDPRLCAEHRDQPEEAT